MRPLSGIFRISGCLPLDHTCPNAADFHPMQANMCCESKQTTICENIGKRSLSLPDLYSFCPYIFILEVCLECVCFVKLLPRQIHVGASEVAVCCGLLVDRAAQVKHLDDAGRS